MSDRETTYYDCKDRYQHDPHFKALVDTITHWSIEYKYTPGELRDAAYMAALNFEMMHARTSIVFADERKFT